MTSVLTWIVDAKTGMALSFLASVLGSLIAFFEVYSLNKKLKAEAKLRKILLSQWEFILQQEHKEMIQDSHMMNFYAWKAPEAARNQIEDALKQLPESDRQSILEALRQPSEKGRHDYIRKLLSWSKESSA